MNDLLVKLPIYEGPLDLLLHLIQKNQVAMDDIPVAVITAQYLEYLNLMESFNVEVAADFLVMAATLTHIKSRLLLPAEDEEETELIKENIINPLLEHLGVNFQEAASLLGRRQVLGRDVFGRGLSPAEDAPLPSSPLSGGLVKASLLDLVEAVRRLAAGAPPEPTLEFQAEPKSLDQRLKEVREFLKKRPQASFEELLGGDFGRNELVLTFLAVLELARLGFLRLYQAFFQDGEEAGLRLFLAAPEGRPES